MANELGVSDRVRFQGEVTDPEVLRDFFSRAIAYVSPGAVGLAVLHAFAYGVPVITGRENYHGPEADNLNSENSIIYSSDSDLPTILSQLALEPSLPARLGRNAFELYNKQMTIDAMVAGFRGAIEGIEHPATDYDRKS